MLFSAIEDFERTTLAALPGTLAKLEYVASLRQENGEYCHWGLARVHGEKSAERAISEAHTKLFVLALRMPIAQLWEEVTRMAAERRTRPRALVQDLCRQEVALLPSDLAGGCQHHFNSVLVALEYLANGLERKNNPTASPRRRPAR